MNPTLTIATRQSPLALWQANWVKAKLEQLHPDITIQLLGLTTTADAMVDLPLNKVGGKGLFVKELEEALLDGRADLAVHSLKDMPMQLPEGLTLGAVTARVEVRDAFISDQYANLDALPKGAVIGTSSLRRQGQILAGWPHLTVQPLRGNVGTRLARLAQGEFAGIILAAAGLERLNLQNHIRQLLSLEQSLPAAGQAVLGVECRAEDTATQTLLNPLHDAPTADCITAERALCRALGGNCQVPIAAFAKQQGAELFLRGLVISPDGKTIARAAATAPSAQADALGQRVAKELLQQGADRIIQALNR